MKIAIHKNKNSFSEYWIDYCERKNLNYTVVNAYDNDIVEQLKDCDVFMWHVKHVHPADVLFAKQLLYSLEQAGKKVYPDWKTHWSFDDKVGQKYQLESLDLPLIPAYVFYSKKSALKWAKSYTFPAVFKLRGGAGSYNVKLAKSYAEAKKLIKTSFGRGFRQFSAVTDVKETFTHFLKGKSKLKHVIKAVGHLFIPYQIEKAKGREKGYVYFQEFLPGCDGDIRVQVVGDKCYAMKRFVRKNDFRASGSGEIDFDGSKLPADLIQQSFEITRKMGMQSLAIDWLQHGDKFLIAEISYAWGIAKGELDPGYWDDKLNWHSSKVDLGEWFVELMLKN